MWLVDKFKELFVDEEEDGNKEVKIEHTQEIKIEEKTKNKEKEVTMTERELFKSPSTFNFPVIFDEEDLKPLTEEKKSYSFDRTKGKNKEKEPEKKFVASPVISPIYGILDKNYKKDEITNRSEEPDYESKRKDKKINVDTIRQKAFGTLEEDVEKTILGEKNFIYGLKEEEAKVEEKEPINEEKEDPIVAEMGLADNEKEKVTLEEAYENYSDYGVEYKKTTTIEEETEEPAQKTEVLDDDLFELINSMYKEDEEDK